MNDLRFIILIVGLIVIAIIYLWETITQRQQQRKQTVKPSLAEKDIPELIIANRSDIDDDDSVALSDVNEFMYKSRTLDREAIQEFSQQIRDDKNKQDSTTGLEPPLTIGTDLFSPISDKENETDNNELSGSDPESHIKATDKIIILHITASSIKPFNGREILDAVEIVGMEYGEMNIFHHYGIGEIKNQRPLFSLADMFEPGSFDLVKIDSINTRGLSLILSLPTSIDGQVVFELMLNTAQRLAEQLGGEIRDSNHNLIDDLQIDFIRQNISLQMQ